MLLTSFPAVLRMQAIIHTNWPHQAESSPQTHIVSQAELHMMIDWVLNIHAHPVRDLKDWTGVSGQHTGKWSPRKTVDRKDRRRQKRTDNMTKNNIPNLYSSCGSSDRRGPSLCSPQCLTAEHDSQADLLWDFYVMEDLEWQYYHIIHKQFHLKNNIPPQTVTSEYYE